MLQKFFIFLSVSVVSALCSVACQSAPAAQGTAQLAPGSEHVHESGKLTPPAKETPTLRLGIRITMSSRDKDVGPKIAKSFEDQLSVFEPCLDSTVRGKTEVITLMAQFKVLKKGTIGDVLVTKVTPDTPLFAKCFLKQIEQLDVGSQKKVIKGSLTLATFYGSEPEGGWGPKVQNIQQ